MATFDDTTSTGQSIPGGGFTLDALMARQRELAQQQGQIQQEAQPTIAGGIGQMLNAYLTGARQRHFEDQYTQGRAALAQAMARVNPQTGEWGSPADAATAWELDPTAAAATGAAALQGHLAAARQAEAEAAAMGQQKERETYESGLPQTPRAKALADYTSGKFGTVGSPEAIAARDAAIRASEAPQLSIEDRKERNRLSDIYTQTDANLGQLDAASKLIEAGIGGGSNWSAAGQWLGRTGLGIPGAPDAETIKRTDQFNLIMNQGGLTDTISKVLGPAAAANFVRQMTDMTVDPQSKKAILADMIKQLKAGKETTRARLQEVAPNEPLPKLASEQPTSASEQPTGARTASVSMPDGTSMDLPLLPNGEIDYDAIKKNPALLSEVNKHSQGPK